MHIEEFINQFKTTCERIVSLIGQFFKEKRIMTIYGEQGGTDMRQIDFDPKKVFGSMEAYRKPGFVVRVIPQRASPDSVRVFNETVLKMVELAANGGTPIPPHLVAKLLQMTGKEQIIPVLEEADAQRQMLIQLQQQVEMLAQENEQLKQGVTELMQTAENQRQMMLVAGQQMAGQGQAQPSMPAQQSA
jgi:hypothetical protein